MASRVAFSPTASRDLDEIVLSIAEDNPQAALRMYDEIRHRCFNLADMPEVGVRIGRGLRRLVVEPYLVFYRVKSGKERSTRNIEIIRVIHGARQIPKDLGGWIGDRVGVARRHRPYRSHGLEKAS